MELKCLGYVGPLPSTYPFFCLSSQRIARTKPVLRLCLAAGIHGDEPAGVEAVVRFLEKTPDLPTYALTVFPCLNPWGYDQGTRENVDGVDLNRQFHRKDPPDEVSLVRQAVAGSRYDLFLCCHEDTESNGFYLYETSRGKRPKLGFSIISAIREIASIDHRPRIDGRINQGGIVFPANWPRRKSGWSLALYLYRHGTPHCLILEAPTRFPFEERVRVHKAALDHVFSLLNRPMMIHE